MTTNPNQAPRNKTTESKQNPQRYVLETVIGLPDWVFTGILLGSSTTWTPRKTQWFEMSLYRVTEGPNTGHYILETIGRSDIYHRVNVDCKGSQNGEPMSRENLPDDVRPCSDCKPDSPDRRGAVPTRVVLEIDIPTLSECVTPADVLAEIKKGANGRVSFPAQKLLSQAALNDADLRAALDVVRTI